MNKAIISFSISLFLTSCAGVHTGVKFENISLKNRTFVDVPINTIIKNEIGDKLITTGEEEYQDALKIVESPEYISFGASTVKYRYSKNQIFPLSGSTKEWYLYYETKDKTERINYGVAVSRKDEKMIVPFVKLDLHNGTLATKKLEGFKTQKETFINNNCSNCFKQEFIYNGKIGSSLKFIYREYVNDMIRPAFNQELQYDLNESYIVGFKGLRIEIVNATNTNIEYKILSSFNKPK